MNDKLKDFLSAVCCVSIPMVVMAYFYGHHGMLIYFIAFGMGMFFQSRG